MRLGCVVGARRSHGVVGVADGHDARADRDLRAAERVGVSLAVDAFVAGADELGDIMQGGGGGEDALADDWVAADVGPLVGVEGAGLVEDGFRDGDLADVVQLGGEADSLDLFLGQAQVTGGFSGEGGDVV